MDRIIVSIIALIFSLPLTGVLYAVSGKPDSLFHLCVKALIGPLVRKLNQKKRSNGVLKTRGFMIMCFTLSFCIAAPYFLATPYRLFIETAILAGSISTIGIWLSAYDAHRALKKASTLKHARDIGKRAFSLELSKHDKQSVTRLIATALTRHFTRQFMAPMLWYLLAGFYGLLITVLITSLYESTIGKSCTALATWIRRAYGLVSLPTSLISAVLLCFAAIFVPGISPLRSLKSFLHAHQEQQKGPFADKPVACLAWGLNQTLGGPETHAVNGAVLSPWIGPQNSSAQTPLTTLDRVLTAIILGSILVLLALCGFIQGLNL